MRARLFECRGIRLRQCRQIVQRSMLSAAQMAEKNKPVAEAVVAGEDAKAVGTLTKQFASLRQDERCGFFGRWLEGDRLILHVDSIKAGDAEIFSAEPPKRKLILKLTYQ